MKRGDRLPFKGTRIYSELQIYEAIAIASGVLSVL